MAHKRLMAESGRHLTMPSARPRPRWPRASFRGPALLRSIADVDRAAGECSGDERTGALILRRALEAPTRQIAENSGADGGMVVDRMIGGTGAYGFDASRGTYGDLIEVGIIDPTKVVRATLENAVSVAGALLLTEATLTEMPEVNRNGSSQRK